MKFAISTDSDFVSEHFGRCPSFTLLEVEGGKVLNKEVIGNPGHHPGYIPQFLHSKGVNCIIAGGMGMRAKSFFQDLGIDTVLGVTGKVDKVIEDISRGNLKGSEGLCRPGAGRGYGIEKSECDHPEDKDQKNK
ncbi:MAG: dinitrogenase iron-molybdenum cofactor [Candidatus Omnitrophica bacterium]|nr:dinitrogenase iron-molybdenum cofactor [Candidatus Omnitrophota bacterium]MBD3269755.1 dinitrogenase iron-molybdenum cofactor [Candidatus Omnitrophota bacterium]